MERTNKNLDIRQRKDYHNRNEQKEYGQRNYHLKNDNIIRNGRYGNLYRSKSNNKSRDNSNDRKSNMVIEAKKYIEMKQKELRANIRNKRVIKTPDRNLNISKNNRSHHSNTPHLRKKNTPLKYKSPYNAKITPNRIKRNLSDDKIVPKIINKIAHTKISTDYNYHHHHYNKTPSPLGKASYQISNHTSSDNKTSNNSFAKYARSSQCNSNYKLCFNSNNNNNQISSNYKISKALNDINSEINSIYNKNIEQNKYKNKGNNTNNINNTSNLSQKSSKDINFDYSFRFYGSYNGSTSNNYLNSNDNIISQPSKGYQTATNKGKKNYINANEKNIPYKHSQNSDNINNNNLHQLPLLEKSNSFLEDNEKLYFSNNTFCNKDIKSYTNSTYNNSIGKINSSYVGGNSSNVSRGNNSSENSRAGKNLETIEEVHLAFVNMIQSSKKLLSTQEKNEKERIEFNTTHDNNTVIKFEEQDII